MSDPIFFAPMRVPLVDPRTGLISREWYLFFQAMFLRSGGTNGPNVTELTQIISDTFGTPEILAIQLTGLDAAAQSPTVVPSVTLNDVLGELQATRDQVAELAKQLDDLRQGTML